MKKLLLSLFILSTMLCSCSKEEPEPSFSDFQIYTINETDYACIVKGIDSNHGNTLGSMESMPKSTNIGRFSGAKKVLLDIEWYKSVNSQWVKFQSANAVINSPNRDYTIKFAGNDYMLN